jgi:drug/metabolite transporter (DMT)-like permease
VLSAFLSSRIWLSGLALMLGGWVLYLVAAKFAPISIIQPTLGVGLAVLALFSVFYLHEKITALEWAAFTAMLSGMVLLGASAVEEASPPPPQWFNLLAVTGLVLLLALTARGLGNRRVFAGMRTDSLLGMFAGLFIGLAAVYTKAMFTFLDDGQRLAAFAVCLPVMIAANVIGLAVMQSGFQHGKALVVVSLEAVVNKVVAILGGMLALAEALPEDPVKAAVRLSAFALILFGTGALSRFGGAEVAGRLEPQDEAET